MFDKLIELKNNAINRIANLDIVQGMGIVSGISMIFGVLLINLFSDDELNTIETYDDQSSSIETDYDITNE